MKKFIIRLLYILPIPLFIMGVNYFEDPANIFRKGQYEAGIVDYLVRNKNVTNVSNYDERLLQRYFVEKMGECPETVIMGSSRVMQLGRSYFDGQKSINNGVSGASLEDFLAIYRLYEKRGCKLKKIYIGLEPYFLNENNDQTRWKVLTKEYNELISEIGLKPDTGNVEIIESEYTKYKELWSFSYFKNSLSYLFRGIDVNYRPADAEINKDLTKCTDGSITYSEESRNSSMAIINGYANASINEVPMYSMREFDRFSEKNKLIFSKFIEYLQHQGIELEFLVLPYHPLVYDYCKANTYYHTVFDAEKYYYEQAGKYNIHITGSYNPQVNGYTDSSFYDGFHCKESTLSEVLRKSKADSTRQLNIKN